MLGIDEERLIWIIQLVSLCLVAIQSIPQIKLIHEQKEDAVQNLSLQSWIYKSLFSVFFVVSLFAGETTMVIVATQIINLTMSIIITSQIAYYSHLQVIPEPLHLIDAINELGSFEEEDADTINIPVLHNLLKQIYVFGNFNLHPKLLM